MKKNHEQVMALIQRAIAECGYDNVMEETKGHLSRALNSVAQVAKKRKRNIATQKANELGRQKHNEWWEMLKKNAAEKIDLSFLEPDNIDNEGD